MGSANVRLAGRALVAGAAAALVSGQVDWRAAVVAGVLAFCEVFTPLNGLVGLFKTPEAV